MLSLSIISVSLNHLPKVHSQCAEPFYKREVEDQIRNAPTTTAGEKKKMMDLLKRFEEDSPDDNLVASDADDDIAIEGGDENELTSKLEGIDLDSADPDFILSLLSDSQRKAFLKTVQDPTGEPAQELLASDEIHKYLFLPWWTKPSGELGDGSPLATGTWQFGGKPDMLELSQALLNNALPSKFSLFHNVFALVLAYAAATRSVGTSPLSSSISYDTLMAEEIISKAVPFLTDPKSTTVFPSVDSAWTNVVSRLDDVSRSTLRTLLQDAEALLRPSLISETHTSNPLHGSPLRNTLLAISDIHAVYSGRSKSGTKPSKLVQRKLEFYAVHIYASKPPEWELILAVIRKKLDDFRGDDDAAEMTVEPKRTGRLETPIIEEL
ncbi:hypothetical protein FS837_008683 [Tulasnella sp. UAMH 9824]|nr:hypothetical protein FS837_008683 [Tulasnella sp. UAMH 9824]